MASIIQKKNREGKNYIYLKESYRVGDKVKSRILKSYGQLELLEQNEPGILERLKSEAKAGLLNGEATNTLELALNLDTRISYDEKQYGWKILSEIYDMLKIRSITAKAKTRMKCDLDKILRLLVFQRILNPRSKLQTFESQKNLWGNWDVKEHDIYRSLDVFETIKEDIQLKMHQSIKEHIGRVATLVFYDVTNYYFEIDMNDEDVEIPVAQDDDESIEIKKGLRKRGPSKERQPKPIVQMGLFMDTNGIPISYQLFSGNQTDPVTYLPAIEQVKKQFGIERIVVVADKAMNSKKNVKATNENGDGWLFSQKHRGKRGASKAVQEFLLDENGWEYNEKLTFAKKSMIHERTLEKGNIVKEKIVATWSEKYARREQIRRDGAVRYAEGLTNAEKFRASCKRGGKKYIEMSVIDKETGELKKLTPFLGIDEEAIAFDAQFDGMNVLVTSEIDMDDDEVITHYHELSRIEDCFRITKTEFDARPVFVSLENHIQSHFLTCFIALVILRILQYKTNRQLSSARLITALQSAKANELVKGYQRVQANEDLQLLNEMIGIEWNKAYVKSEELEKYAKHWCTTK